MVGGWAAAIVATAAAGKLVAAGFARLVRVALADEMRKVWQELHEQDDWFHAQLAEVKREVASIGKELRPNSGASLRDTVDRLELMMMEHMDGGR